MSAADVADSVSHWPYVPTLIRLSLAVGCGDGVRLFKAKTSIPIQLKGYRSVIREGDDLKIRMLIWNITPAPAATPSPTASPSNQ
jgi:hypothetical protein